MNIAELMRWPSDGYPKYHQYRPTLLIHIVAVPLFMVGTLALAGAIVKLPFLLLGVAVGFIVVAVAL